MKKIISLFQRNYETDHLVRNEIVPGAEWVAAGEGVCTVKYDGSCCLVRDGKLYKRYEIKAGKKAPANFEAANEVDEVTGKQQGWLPVGEGPDDRWHREAFAAMLKWAGFDKGHQEQDTWLDGTYELCGPKVNGNPEGYPTHVLVPHGYGNLFAFPRTYDEIKAAFADPDWRFEGVVWHHPDGRMVKIKVRDFGLKRKRND